MKESFESNFGASWHPKPTNARMVWQHCRLVYSRFNPFLDPHHPLNHPPSCRRKVASLPYALPIAPPLTLPYNVHFSLVPPQAQPSNPPILLPCATLSTRTCSPLLSPPNRYGNDAVWSTCSSRLRTGRGSLRRPKTAFLMSGSGGPKILLTCSTVSRVLGQRRRCATGC